MALESGFCTISSHSQIFLELTQEDVAGGVAPHPPERALHLPRRRTGHRPGCHRGGAGVGLTEFSGLWAYNPMKFTFRVFSGGMTPLRLTFLEREGHCSLF